MNSLRFRPDGTYQHVEIFGPSSFDFWLACWEVFACAMVMLGAASIGAMNAYATMVNNLVQRYGPSCWPLIYEAEAMGSC